MSNRWLLFTLVAGPVCMGVVSAQSTPPAQGPPAVSGTAYQSYLVNSFLTPQVRARIDNKIAALNAEMAARPDARAKLTVSALNVWSPRQNQTKFSDRPNEWFVNVPHMLILTVSDIKWKSGTVNCYATPQYPGCPAAHGQPMWSSYPWNRKVTVSIDAETYCDGWENGSGHIKVVGRSDPPYLDPNPGPLESVLDFFLGSWLVDTVNARIHDALGGGDNSMTETNWACRSLSAFPGLTGLDDDEVRWNVSSTIRIDPYPITFRPIRIKRLPAHRLDGGVLYSPIESPIVEMWGGYGSWSELVPSMAEGEELPLLAPAITVYPHPTPSNPLLIIASISQFDAAKDSAYKLFPSSIRYGAGTQSIVVSKTYWRPPVPPLTKPIKMTVPAYEITFEVNVPSPVPIQYDR